MERADAELKLDQAMMAKDRQEQEARHLEVQQRLSGEMGALLPDGVLTRADAQVWRTRGTREMQRTLCRLGARGPVVVGALRGLGDVALGERDARSEQARRHARR